METPAPGPRLIDSVTIEMHRMSYLGDGGHISPGIQYIALWGSNAPPTPRQIDLDHESFLRLLHNLRYPGGADPSESVTSLQTLGKEAARLLPGDLNPIDDTALQIDLVLSAAELWALPFEACARQGRYVFADRARPLIITRRIRQGFAGERKPWPVRPRVLFMHAQETGDLKADLIERHKGALASALGRWSKSGDPRHDGLLEVRLALGIGDVQAALTKAREEGRPFSHVHILAHGKPIHDPITQAVTWGLRLGDQGREATDPGELSDVLQPKAGLPIVVSVAACDAANQANTVIPRKSFAQELHRRGIPVVLASQLPLTKEGSVTMTRAFYDKLLCGDDVRLAVFETRVQLHDDDKAGHDWVSVVAYVQLPEGYAHHLMEMGVELEMELLKAARSRLDSLGDLLDARGEEALNELERNIRERTDSLERRLQVIPAEFVALRAEAQGVLASAHKRLAELYFRRGERLSDPQRRSHYRQVSQISLNAALENYRAAFRGNIQNHWLGTQCLSLEAVLRGDIGERDWQITQYAAELALAADEKDCWPYGTLAELWLLAGLNDGSEHLAEAKEALALLVSKAETAGNEYAITSTRDQLRRYVQWWTTTNAFFNSKADLAAGAAELERHLNSILKGGEHGV